MNKPQGRLLAFFQSSYTGSTSDWLSATGYEEMRNKNNAERLSPFNKTIQ